jgi:hypothetical protein
MYSIYFCPSDIQLLPLAALRSSLSNLPRIFSCAHPESLLLRHPAILRHGKWANGIGPLANGQPANLSGKREMKGGGATTREKRTGRPADRPLPKHWLPGPSQAEKRKEDTIRWKKKKKKKKKGIIDLDIGQERKNYWAVRFPCTLFLSSFYYVPPLSSLGLIVLQYPVAMPSRLA